MEIDILIPSLKIAIEYNGRFWHGVNEKKNPGYHKRKAEACRDAGLKLINVPDYIWDQHRGLARAKIFKGLFL